MFFDWDRYNLTHRARQIIAEAAANSTKVQDTRIEVNGYTDTSGTPKYNLGLSIRRADAVKAELIKDGVPEKEPSRRRVSATLFCSLRLVPVCVSRRTVALRSSFADRQESRFGATRVCCPKRHHRDSGICRARTRRTAVPVGSVQRMGGSCRIG